MPCWRAKRGRRTAQHGGGVVRALTAVQAVQLVRQPAHKRQLDLLLHEAQAAVDDRGRDRHPREGRQACPPRTPQFGHQGATACMLIGAADTACHGAWHQPGRHSGASGLGGAGRQPTCCKARKVLADEVPPGARLDLRDVVCASRNSHRRPRWQACTAQQASCYGGGPVRKVRETSRTPWKRMSAASRDIGSGTQLQRHTVQLSACTLSACSAQRARLLLQTCAGAGISTATGA